MPLPDEHLPLTWVDCIVGQDAKSEVGVMQNWQTIETAPVDGSKVLLWARHHDLPDATFSFMVGRYDIIFGWVVTSPDVAPIVPTHWMQLPDAPTAA